MTSLLYEKFEMPDSIKIDTKDDRMKSRFVAEPFERGFGHTIGNALRRMLLNSIEAPAIISLFIEGVPHEYMAVEGIKEDVTNIVLNLKEALLRKVAKEGDDRRQRSLKTEIEVTEEDLKENGQKVITLGNLVKEGEFEVVNPELPIFTATQPMKRMVQLRVAFGRGYVPSERHQIEHKLAGEIDIDSIFSPVRLVNYFVEDTRVGQDTDFDRLVLEVTTDGRLTPNEALAFAAKILTKHLTVFDDLEEGEILYQKAVTQDDTDRNELLAKLSLGIHEIELSVRSTNCLNGANIDTIGELVVMSEPRLLQFRNFGKKSLNEIKAKLSEMKLSLGMDLSRFGITQDNVKDVLAEYADEDKGGAV